MCFKASETVSWMLDVAVGARSSPRRKDLLHRPTAKKTNRKNKTSRGNGKVLSSQALLSPKSFSQMLSSGATLFCMERTPAVAENSCHPPRGDLGGHQSAGPPGPTGDGDIDPWQRQGPRGGTSDSPARQVPAASPATGLSPRARCAGRYLVWGCGQVRRACGQRRAPGRRRCRHPWGSPRPCPCACPWGPGGCHPSTWGGNQGPALQGKNVATSAPIRSQPPPCPPHAAV